MYEKTNLYHNRIANPTFYYVNGTPSSEAEKFIEFTLSTKGKEIVEKVGFVAPE